MENDFRETPDSVLAPESEGLGAFGNGFVVIGWVPEVNGEGALEVNEFVPTRHEVSIIARNWLREVRDIRFDFFCYRQSGSRETRVLSFACRRLDSIERILGEVALQQLDRDVMSELEAKVDPQLWKMFLTGEEPERDGKGLPILPPTQ
jgi:hypothetical protein